MLSSSIKNGHVFRYAEIEAVTKVLSCKTHKLGARKYSCSNKNCSHKKHVFNTCAKANYAHRAGRKPLSGGLPLKMRYYLIVNIVILLSRCQSSFGISSNITERY